MTTRVLLVEDEPIARRHLRELLAEFEWMTCIGEARDGRRALELIDSLRPDLVFLDIELPEPSGLEVLRRMTHDPAIVITTAYDRYAVAAFELEAVDYLLKPFGPERLRKTAERLHRTVSLPGEDASPPAGTIAASATCSSIWPMAHARRVCSCATEAESSTSPSARSSVWRRRTTTSP